MATASSIETLAHRLRVLTPRDDVQRSIQPRALELAESMLYARWAVAAGAGTSVSLPFLIVLVFWLTVTFTIFGLLAPRNATVVTVFLVCSLSVASAMFFILEMDGPFDGLVRVSADPLRFALAHLNK